MPMAVMTESSENTMSSSMTCAMTARERRRHARRAVRRPRPRAARESRSVAFASRNRPPPIRIRSRPEIVAGPTTVNSGSVSRTIQTIENSSSDAHEHGRDQADPARALLLFLGQLAGQDRNEDDVVDAEDDLENGQCRKRNQQLSHESSH